MATQRSSGFPTDVLAIFMLPALAIFGVMFGPQAATLVIAFAIVGIAIGVVFAYRRLWLLLVSVCVSAGIYLALCFREGIFSFRFALWQITVDFWFHEFRLFFFFCLLPTIVAASLVGSWRVKHWPKHNNAI